MDLYKLFREEGHGNPEPWYCAQGMPSLLGDDKNLKGKPLVKHVMSSWINAGESLVSMVATRLLIQALALPNSRFQ